MADPGEQLWQAPKLRLTCLAGHDIGDVQADAERPDSLYDRPRLTETFVLHPASTRRRGESLTAEELRTPDTGSSLLRRLLSDNRVRLEFSGPPGDPRHSVRYTCPRCDPARQHPIPVLASNLWALLQALADHGPPYTIKVALDRPALADALEFLRAGTLERTQRGTRRHRARGQGKKPDTPT